MTNELDTQKGSLSHEIQTFGQLQFGESVVIR